jgi:hypothetical protein
MLRSILAVVLTLATAFAVTAQGQTLTYGAWQADLGSAAGTEASTVNESGSRFGFVCVVAINQCTYYISAHTTCTPGVASTILINTDAGALSSTITCTNLGGTYYNAIQDTSDLHDLVVKSKNLGIAFPMESGLFKVVRFSLDGAASAIYTAATKASELGKNADHMQ